MHLDSTLTSVHSHPEVFCKELLSTSGLQTRPENRWGSYPNSFSFALALRFKNEPCGAQSRALRWRRGLGQYGHGMMESFRKFLCRTKRFTQSLLLKPIATFLSYAHSVALSSTFFVIPPCHMAFSFLTYKEKTHCPLLPSSRTPRTGLTFFIGPNFCVTEGLSRLSNYMNPHHDNWLRSC